MARPPKSGLDYFPLDVDFFEDEKIVAIAREFGVKGEIIALRLLCAVYRNGYFALWDEAMKIKLLQNVPGVSSDGLEQIVSRLVKWGLFDGSLFRSVRVMTSRGIQKRYINAIENRSEVTIFADYWLIPIPENTKRTTFRILPTQSPVMHPQNVIMRQQNPVMQAQSTQRKVEESILENAAAPAREPDDEAQVLTAKALPAYAETVIAPDCLARFRTYCNDWNAVVGKPRIPLDIPHYAEKFAITEHQCQDITLFSRVIEHLREHPQSVVRTGKISLKTITLFSVDFAQNVVSGAYDIDFSQKQQMPEKRGKRGGRYCPAPTDYTGEF